MANNKIENFNKDESYGKIYAECLPMLLGDLSYRDFTWLIQMFQFLNKDDNTLVNDDMYLSIKDIGILLDINYDNLRRVFKTWEEKEIVKKVERQSQKDVYKTIQVLAVNPFIVLNGDNISKDVHNKFKNTKWAKLFIKNKEEGVRGSKEYKEFMAKVLERENNTCQCCGSGLNLDVHHIMPYAKFKERRTDPMNGITLCECCHSPMIFNGFHQKYGTRNNTPEQLLEYIQNKRKELGIVDKSFINSPFLLEYIDEI